MEHSPAEIRLAAAGFEVIAISTLPRHVVITRGGYAALVERIPTGYGRAGSAGWMSEHGFAALIWRGANPYFAARDFQRPATNEEVETLRTFSADLEAALAPES